MWYRQRKGGGAKVSAFELLSGALVAAGVALRLWQYLGRSALWTDEATLAASIVERSLPRLLLEPLGYNQAAPPGFLALEKGMVTLLGVNELALRAVPLVASIAALVLIWRAAGRLLSSEAVPLAIAPLALAPPMLFFAADAKQYSSDVAIALVLVLLALDAGTRELTPRRAAVTAVVGALAVWFSQPGVMMIAGLGAALAIHAARARAERRSWKPLVWIVGVWCVSAIAVAAVSLRRLAPGAHAYMYLFWNRGFWPLSPVHPASWAWPFLHTAMLLVGELGLPTSVGAAGVLLSIVGAASLWKRSSLAAMVLIAPPLIALGASLAHLYPFAERLSLFLIPSLLLLAAAGLEELAEAMPTAGLQRGVIVCATALLAVLGARALRNSPPVYRIEEITPAIAHLARNSAAGDVIYVHYGAVPAFQFYERTNAIHGTRVLGGCHRGEPRAYLTELDALRGRARVWVLFSHELPRLRERQLITSYLDDIGTARDSVITSGRDVDGNVSTARLYLYDLSNAAKLARANAHDFRIAEQPAVDRRLLCAPAGE